MHNTLEIAPPPVLSITSDYSLFKLMKGNRTINPLNLKRITDSMSKKPLFSPILVNEKMEIIDGQHRFRAMRELKLPINYIIIEGYGLDEVHILNSNSANWTRMDFLEGYADMGLRPYIQFKEFMTTFPGLGIVACLGIINKAHEKGGRGRNDFKDGKLIIKDYEFSKKVGNIIMDYSKLYKGFGRTAFVTAIANIAKNPNYIHEEMMAKLSRYPAQLTDQTTSKNYILVLENIFNYHRRKQVSLRF